MSIEDGIKDFLVCSLCEHSLDNPAYKVCQHPLLPVPICLLCSDQFSENFKCNDDKCSWCGEESSTLVLCGGEESTCEHAFCKNCLITQLGEARYSDILADDEWTCLYCQPSPDLDLRQRALEYGQLQSIYCNSTLLGSRDLPSEIIAEEVDPDGENLQREIYLYRTLIEESKLAINMLENEQLSSVSEQISSEGKTLGRYALHHIIYL